MPVSGQDLIGQRIRTTRRQRGLSQAQLAHPELSDSYVSLIESGKRTPTAAVLELLAAKLECSLTYLINGVTAEQMQDLELRLGYASMALNNGEVAEARRRYAELLEDGSLVGLRSLMQQAEFGYALASEACGDLRDAIDVLLRLRESAGDSLPADQSIALALALSRCYREHGDLGEAVQVAEEILLGPTRPIWTDELVELGATLLAAYIIRWDLLRAQQFAAELLSAAEVLGTPRATVAACWNAAEVAELVGRGDEALFLVERALAVQSETGDQRNLVRLRGEYAILMLRARPEAAVTSRDLLLRAEREMAESSAGAVTMAWAYIYLAKAEMLLGNAQKAVAYGRQAKDLLVGDRAPALLTDARLVLASALLQVHETTEAVAELEAVEQSLEHAPASPSAAEGWLAAATMLEQLDDGGEASVAAYQRALTSVGL
ncbi:helix-turn-helix domain-containing protein [Sphaerisporangium dianthi]|uniref:Helix-turn-helix domain-containing protein n=1 Tax=Sphaerisporangium dianthi TaxID=1436120 RepID=A0ABV9CGP6_9ACTN